MVKVIAQNFIKSECIEKAASLFREIIAATLKEKGCIEYSLFVDNKDKTCHIFVETWESQEALDAHCNSEHFKRIIPQIGELKLKDGQTFFMEEFK